MKDIYFIRYGNLNSVKHKEHSKENDFHTAPRKMGIYAFPRGYVERFLIGSSFTNHWRKWLLDEKGNKILYNDLWDDDYKLKPKYKKLLQKRHIKERNLSSYYYNEIWYTLYIKFPKIFQYKGLIWSHLEDYVSSKDIIDRYGSWIKTTYQVYCKALHKCNINDRFQSYINPIINNSRHGNPHTFPSKYSKDHYEVFIEHL